MVKSQGGTANKHGKIIESMLFPLFEQNNYAIAVCYSKKSKCYPNYLPYEKNKQYFDSLDRLVLYQAPYTSIYPNKDGKTEFLIINKPLNRRIRVECKWQQSGGSADEKIPYLYLNAVFAFPEKEIIVVMDGGALDKTAKQWLIDRCNERWLLDNQPDKSIEVMSIAEFTAWFNKELA